MEYGILGPLTVCRDGRELRLGGAKQRSVLAVLLLRANELVPTARIVDELWGERPTATAVKAVQVQVSQLRKLLDPGALETRPSGYLLRVEPGALDLERFESLLDQGRGRLAAGEAGAAGELLREALGLWRGSPLAEFEYEAFARNEIGRLEELRLAALELRLEADLALGRHSGVVGELEGLVRDHPLRESFCRLLILALYRAGRQADALTTYQHARTRLLDELGLDPSQALQQLEKQILLQDPALDLPATAQVAAPSAASPPIDPTERPRPDAPAARKIVSVVCCDVAAYDPLGGLLDPEALQLVISRCFERVAAVVERHGGSVENAFDRELMAVFGVPAVHEDDALRAVRAAVEIRDTLPELGVQARIGVTTGEVVAAAASGRNVVTGDAVAVTKRLEQAAAPGDVLIGEATLALVRGATEVEPIGLLELPGRAEPVAAYRVLLVRDGPERAHGMPFVGREHELALLREAWERVSAEQRCELVTVVGDGGVGKSRLIAEALAPLGGRVVHGRCLPYGEGITYWPVVEVLEQLDVLPSNDAAATAIRSLLGETETVSSADEIAWGFRKTLEHAAAERPLVVVLDDVHWGEGTFLDLVEQTALLSSGGSILLLCLARPELLERRPSWTVTLRLGPLGDPNVQELIQDRIPAPMRDQITRAAGGNPLFVQEMLAFAGEAEGEVIVPPTLKALLAARLDQLDPGERAVVGGGAVEGEVFHHGAVQALARDETRLTARLAALVRKELIRPERPELPHEDAFRFCHLLIRDAAYDALPKATRAELHERFAGWLELHGSALVEVDQLLGYHLSQAYRYRTELGGADDATRALGESAARRLAAAGFRASARGDLGGAASLLGRATALLLTESRERIDVVLALVEPLAALMRVAEIEPLLEQAGRAAELLGDELLTARVNVERAWIVVHTTAEQWSDSALLSEIDEAIAVFERLGDDVAVARALEVVTMAHLYHGRLSEVAAASERGYRHAERARYVKLQGKHRLGREVADQWGVTPLDRIEVLLEEDLVWARGTGSLGG